ncbi:MAG: cyanophycinase [Cyanobacteria bacterium M5B4]|nr:MAG: cyanophycinase [Cyanobacteria bacterium M5B4]
MTQPNKPAVIVIGGGEDKVQERKVLKLFVSYAGATDARIAIIPSASREPHIIGKIYTDIFQELGASAIKVLDIRDRDHAQDPKVLEEVSGVFLTGGDQVRLCALIGDTPLAQEIRERVHSGRLTLAGTSAGAAVMGHHMIASGISGEPPHKEMVSMGIGLGILPGILVDQHFQNRNRMARLITAISAHPDRLGIGIDEDTAAIFPYEQSEIIDVQGSGTVTIIDPQEVSYSNQPYASGTTPLTIHNLRVHILSSGGRFHLIKRIPLMPVI